VTEVCRPQALHSQVNSLPASSQAFAPPQAGQTKSSVRPSPLEQVFSASRIVREPLHKRGSGHRNHASSDLPREHIGNVGDVGQAAGRPITTKYGDLDPVLLRAVRELRLSFAGSRWIFNLDHRILTETPPEARGSAVSPAQGIGGSGSTWRETRSS
jgi:hypothetical protein